VKDPMGSHRANATGTLTLLEEARRAGVRRFVYAGSSSVYGETPGLPKREDMDTFPLSPYGVGKLVGEHYLPVFASLYGMETLALRYFNVFGPRQDADCPYSGVITRFIAALLRGEAPVIAGDGRQSRDFVYVANVVEANLLALHAKGLVGQVVNVATGRRTTFNKLVALLCEEMGLTLAPHHDSTGSGGVRHSVGDVTLAHRLLGYRPTTDLETGLRRTVSWYRNLAAPTVEVARPGHRAGEAVVAP